MKHRRNTATEAENLKLLNHFRDGFAARGNTRINGQRGATGVTIIRHRIG